MTDLMDEPIGFLRHVPPDQKDEIARAVMVLAGKEQPVYVLTPEERADLEEATGEIERGEFATDDEVRAI